MPARRAVSRLASLPGVIRQLFKHLPADAAPKASSSTGRRRGRISGNPVTPPIANVPAFKHPPCMVGLLGVGALLMLANGLAARFSTARTARAVFWTSTASPAILLLTYCVASTPVWDVESTVQGGTWGIVMLLPVVVGVGTISLLGQFFGRLAKGDFL